MVNASYDGPPNPEHDTADDYYAQFKDTEGLSEVHRYGVYPVNRGSVAQTRPERDGAYVLHADYAALAEKLAACEQQLNIREIVTPIRESYIRRGIDGDWAEVVGRLKADLARVTAERDRLRAALVDIRAITRMIGNDVRDNPHRECGAIAHAALREATKEGEEKS